MQSRSIEILPTYNAPLRTVRGVAIAVVLTWTLLGAPQIVAQVDVWTYHNDNLRTGANLHETLLTPGNVNADFFGKLFSCPVDGQIYAQPLYMSNVSIPGQGTHNVVFVVTQLDSVYAFDADGPDQCVQLWKDPFIDPDNGITPFPASESRSGDITPWLGITSTPVIDVNTGTLYVVVKTKEVRDDGNHYVQRLHALDVTTGAEQLNSPVEIGDTIFAPSPDRYTYVSGPCVPGEGNGSIIRDGESVVCFNAIREHARSGLVLANGLVYVAWASHGDNGPYHGWVIGYDAATLQQVDGAVFNTSPNGGLGGIWMGGGAPAVDPSGNNIYFSTGNGTFAIDPSDFCTHPPRLTACNPAYGDSVVKLSLSQSGGLSFADFFTPWDQRSLDDRDADLASGGVLLLPDQPGPHPHLLITSGKDGKIYLVDRDNMGEYRRCGPMCDDVVRVLGPPRPILGEADDTPAYFNTGEERRFYYLGAGDHLRAFALSDGPPYLSLVAEASPPTNFGNKGATPSVSADGTPGGDGGVFNAIVWAIQASSSSVPAVLHAYNAMLTPMTELYRSNDPGIGERDRMGNGLKFTVPTVANGHVYAGTLDRLDVFGCFFAGCR